MQATGGPSPGPSDGLQLSVATLNVLADCYSHSMVLGPELRWKRRKHGIKAALSCCGADILCLQELDHYEDFFARLLRELGYEARYLQRPTRSDGCVVAWKAAAFDCLHELAMDLDKISSNHSWRKHNVALACHLRHRSSGRTFIVCTTHLYWNPRRPEVKFAQARWVADSLHAWEHANGGDVPCVLAGDFNTLPDSDVYAVLTGTLTTAGAASDGGTYDAEDAGEKKFLCDASLNRLCRWLRLCGVDTALETDDEERVRSEQKVFVLFERCKQEGRILLTSSKQLVARRKCPHCYLIDPKALEESFVELCQQAHIRLQRERLLTVCVKCNGAIVESTREAAMASGVNVPEGVEVFACSSCQQPYWWSDRENSGAVRAKRLADHLFDLVTNASPTARSEAASRVGEWKADEDDEDEERGDGEAGESAENATGANDGRERLGSLGGSRKVFNSAYATVHGGEPPYTNWTSTFLGTLDYIFVSEHWRCEGAYTVPQVALIPTSPRGSDVGVDTDAAKLTDQMSTLSISADAAGTTDVGATAKALAAAEIAQATARVAVAFQQSVPGPFPCSNWPSDHMMLVASLVLD